MTERFTRQGCKVTTTFILQPNGTYTENVTNYAVSFSRICSYLAKALKV